MANASNKRSPRTRAVRSVATKASALAAETTAVRAVTADDELIAQRAYQLWLAEGRPDGRALAHWVQAQRDLAAF